MDEKPIANADPQYEETVAPQNPPNSMVNPAARKHWLASSVGIVALLCLIFGVGFAWMFVGRELGQGRVDRDAIAEAEGTSGEHQAREATPGGFDPAPRPNSTRDELAYRGDLSAGARVSLTDVTVERTDGDMFWVRRGNETIAVVAPGGTPTVRAGQRVNVSGTMEGSGDAKRIRASRIDVR